MPRCGRQITTTDGRTEVHMTSGQVVRLHRCNRRKDHDGSCGWVGPMKRRRDA